jgi:uncharacterized lipoprotein YddW (UPF0748 family)
MKRAATIIFCYVIVLLSAWLPLQETAAPSHIFPMPQMKPPAASASASTSIPAPSRETHGLWVASFSLTSPEAVKEIVRRAKDNGFTDLIVQVRYRGDTFYKSSLEPRSEQLEQQPADFDPLGMTIEEAHRVGIKVHAWLNVYVASSLVKLPQSREHLIYKHPDWLMVPRGIAGELYRADPKSPTYVQRVIEYGRAHRDELEGLFTSPAHPDVKENVIKIWLEVAQKYDVDGMHFDYVRYPNPQFDYSRISIDSFKAQIEKKLKSPQREALAARFQSDPMVYASTFPAGYAQFQRDQVTDLVARINKAVKAVKPKITISAAVFADDRDALKARFQDWKSWLQNGWLDVLCPMAYTPSTDLYRKLISGAMRNASGRPVWGGIGAFRQPAEGSLEKIRVTRELGAQGFVIYSYGSSVEVSEINPQGDYLERMRDTIQNAGVR